MRKTLPLLCLLLLAGCRNPQDFDLMGQWVGGFQVENPKPGDLKFKGYIQLYARSLYKMHFDTANQGYDIEGTWTRKGKRLNMAVGKITYQTPNEQDQQIFKLTVIKQEDIRKAYGKAFVLNLDASGKVLVGQLMTIGTLEGKHRFEKRTINQ